MEFCYPILINLATKDFIYSLLYALGRGRDRNVHMVYIDGSLQQLELDSFVFTEFTKYTADLTRMLIEHIF